MESSAAATPPKDGSGGFTAQLAGGATGANGGAQLQFTVRDASGAPLQQVSPLFDAWSHLMLFKPSASGGETLDFAHGHSMTQMQNRVLSVDAGLLHPGTSTGWLQLAGPDGTAHTIEVNFNWPG